MNTGRVAMKLPKAETNEQGEKVPPLFSYSKHHQSLRKYYLSVLDIETSYQDKVEVSGGFEQKLKPESCFVKTISLYDNIQPDEPLEIKGAKTREFSSEIEYGSDCVVKSLTSLVNHSEIIKEDTKLINDYYKNQNLTPEQEFEFKNSKICTLCDKPLETGKKDKKGLGKIARNHDHNDGEFLGATHNSCNLCYKDQAVHVCFIHGGKNFDFHFCVR